MSEQTEAVQSAIDRFNAGDPEALNELFALTRMRIEQIARRMLHGRFEDLQPLEQTDDVVSDASFRLLKALSDVPVHSPIEFYRFAAEMIRRTLNDMVRHHYGAEGSATHRANVLLGESSSASGFVPPEIKTPRADEFACGIEIHLLVRQLPAELLDVFNLLWYYELKQEQAAELLGISIPTVKRRWSATKLALIVLLDDYKPENP